ncbi:hypothetical protein [Chryseolinea lacunae]|uniref:Uncharacterized protein n=1 Tax=Chryseolinea lacunae TaxID=2801331 RepID=A0ABS1KST8_9BACT|nr:hypothetical protein [Chryseolinea lacunae]MBL0742533.1 hypothetical protein [Chryseolinea lacunae]
MLVGLQPGFAQQLQQTNRFELPVARDEVYFDIIPAQDQGVYLSRRLVTTEADDVLELTKLDTVFHEDWKGYLPIDRHFLLMGKKADHKNLYLLFRYRDFSRNDFEVVVLDHVTGKFITHSVRNFIPYAPSEFQVTDNGVLIGGYYNHVPVVMFYSFATHKSKILPGLANETGELTQIKLYPDGTFDVVICARNYQGQKTVWLKNYDADGNLQNNFALQPENGKHLIFARSMKTENNMQLLGGVYGARNSEYSRGLFLASIDQAGMEQVRYYGYGDLENFFKYMKAKREIRVKERIKRRKIKGKRIRFNYRFLVHEIVPYNNQYVLLGEAFYPHYTSVGTNGYGSFFGGRTMYQNSMVRDGRIFDGYQYTHAVVMGFDHNGKLLWDNSFEINDVRTYTLEQYVKLEVQKDKIVLLYLFENELRSKIIQNNQVLEGKTFEPIKTKSETEFVKREQSDINKLEYWYDSFFYAYGVQEIVGPKGKRRVFYINKIVYQ